MENYQEIIEKWKNKKICTSDDYKEVLSNFSILFAYNSGAIENNEINYHNTREIFENGKVINFTGNLRTIYEIENQKKCYSFIIDALLQKKEISELLIKEIHRVLTQGTYDETRWNKGERPGTFKIHDYVIGEEGQGVIPSEVPQEIRELCEELSGIEDKNDDILKAAAYLHCKFENIHAFADYHDIIRTKLDKPSKYKGLALIWSYFFIPEMVLKWAALLQFKTKFRSRYPLNQSMRRCSF